MSAKLAALKAKRLNRRGKNDDDDDAPAASNFDMEAKARACHEKIQAAMNSMGDTGLSGDMKQILNMPPEDRERRHLVRLKRGLARLGCLHCIPKYTSALATELCRVLEYDVYKAETVIFVAGEPADCFYIVVTGTVRIWSRDERGRMAVLMVKQPGQIFGETAINTGTVGAAVNSEVRSAGATVEVNDTELLRVMKDQYMSVIGPAMERDIDDKVQFLSHVAPFNKWPTSLLRSLASKCNRRTYRPMEILIQQDDPATEAYVIECGCCVVVKTMPVPKTMLAPLNLYRDPMGQVVQAATKTQRKIRTPFMTEIGRGGLDGMSRSQSDSVASFADERDFSSAGAMKSGVSLIGSSGPMTPRDGRGFSRDRDDGPSSEPRHTRQLSRGRDPDDAARAFLHSVDDEGFVIPPVRRQNQPGSSSNAYASTTVEMARIWKGSLVGEWGILTKAERTSTVLAETQVQVLVLTRHALLTHVQDEHRRDFEQLGNDRFLSVDQVTGDSAMVGSVAFDVNWNSYKSLLVDCVVNDHDVVRSQRHKPPWESLPKLVEPVKVGRARNQAKKLSNSKSGSKTARAIMTRNSSWGASKLSNSVSASSTGQQSTRKSGTVGGANSVIRTMTPVALAQLSPPSVNHR